MANQAVLAETSTSAASSSSQTQTQGQTQTQTQAASAKSTSLEDVKTKLTASVDNLITYLNNLQGKVTKLNNVATSNTLQANLTQTIAQAKQIKLDIAQAPDLQTLIGIGDKIHKLIAQLKVNAHKNIGKSIENRIDQVLQKKNTNFGTKAQKVVNVLKKKGIDVNVLENDVVSCNNIMESGFTLLDDAKQKFEVVQSLNDHVAIKPITQDAINLIHQSQAKFKEAMACGQNILTSLRAYRTSL